MNDNDLLPASLSILDQEPIVLLDVEEFWQDLSISLSRGKSDRGRGFGMKWQYASIPSLYLKKYISEESLSKTVDWTAITSGEHIVIIIHYVTSYGHLSTSIHCGLIANSTLAISRLRLMGDQIIQAAADRRAKYALIRR